jgi:hypothetical protein
VTTKRYWTDLLQNSEGQPGDHVEAAIALLRHYNRKIWVLEDEVRALYPRLESNREDDVAWEVARKKQEVDDLNTKRNKAIEEIDHLLYNELQAEPGFTRRETKNASDTPGLIMDRLIVMQMKIAAFAVRNDASAHTAMTYQSQRLWDCLHELQYDCRNGYRNFAPARLPKIYA